MRIAGALAALALGASAAGARADCGPDRLGTSRVVEVGTQGGLEVGLKSYPRTIPLADHEVILTFDDGPAAKTTPEILKALADECVRATFFEIGRNAEGLPPLARREVLEGHTVAHHTWSHPQSTLRFMSDEAARADALKGMVAVEKAAYGEDFSGGEPKDLKDLNSTRRSFVFPASPTPKICADGSPLTMWVFSEPTSGRPTGSKTTPEQELRVVMGRLDRAGKGMLLFHDTHQWTADMVPMLLSELKAKGYRIVHMVPGPGNGPTVPAPKGWSSETRG